LICLSISALTGRRGYDWQEPPIDVSGSMHALRQFPALKSLRISLAFLAASLSPHRSKPLALSLPRNLEYLVIRTDLPDQPDNGAPPDSPEWEWTGVALVRAIRAWMGEWKASTPHLRCFHLVIYGAGYLEWTAEMTEQIMQLGAGVGIATQVSVEYHPWEVAPQAEA